MAGYTKHYNFIKPEKTDNYSVEDVEATNIDRIDEILFRKTRKETRKRFIGK